MASNPRQPATRQYVDQSIDAQRHYIDKLWTDAEQRIGYFLSSWQAEQNRQLESRLQAALEKIRPAPTVYPPCSPPDLPTAAAPAGLSIRVDGFAHVQISRQDGRVRVRLR